MKLLVTGGAGFIASNYIRYALSTHPDYQVINLDKLTYAGNLENLKDIERSDRYTFIKGDICDAKLLEGMEFDAIINFAAESHVDRSILDARPFLQTNIIGTYNLLEAARKRECAFLHISTDEVYGSTDKGFFHEDSPLLPNSPYAASKASSDLLVRSYVETHNLKAMITRCSNNYGPYQFPEKLIPLVILNAINKKPVPVYGDGMNVRDWIHVIDHCKAVDAVLHKGAPGEVYNIGSRNERPNLEIIKLILSKAAEILNLDNGGLMDLITFVEDRKGHDRRYAIDPAKMEEQLGWEPETDFEEGISQTIKWYISNEQWWQRILSGDYMQYYNEQYGERLKN
ncbi:MAG TPA: dTDP-glucose 4,6-dehydratase [Nitrospirae bacterium]|nr:dTDP-glucose 4,6-dehydratase 2 [bacterium BMS3Abin06]HDH13307.1 dTDP-glucose 4,6-dehydratase [Nitrospirota bacterium]HDZ00647.1 dTDP-glucose 4,6-dehydratase [Nitrospirota bacterium]